MIATLKTVRLRWLPKAILAVATSYFALLAFRLFAYDSIQAAILHGEWFFRDVATLICAVLAILLALSLCLPSPVRANVALLVASSGAAVLLVEVLLHLQGDSARAFRDKVTVQFAQKANRPVGQLDLWDFIRDLRRNGVAEAFPFIGAPHNQAISQSDGPRLMTLAGISEVMTVICNESGRFEPYFSDEHGFNNPLGLHDGSPLEVVLVGDSFTHNGCVRRADSVAGRIRTSIPRTLNLGIRGSGPLTGLGALIEYASMAEPRIVVWGWYEGNDLKDIVLEARKPELRRYLNAQHPFGLKALQGEVDSALRGLIPGLKLAGQTQMLGDLLVLRSTRSRLGLKNSSIAPRSAFALTEAVLGTARDLVRSWGGQLVLVYQPGAERYCGRVESWHNECNERRQYMAGTLGVRDEAIDLFKRLGVPVVDGHIAFLETGRPGDMFFHPFSHYSPEGYRVIAEAVLRKIRPMLHIPVDADRNPSTPRTARSPATMFGSR